MLRLTLFIFVVALLSCKRDKTTATSKIETTPGISSIYAIDILASKSEWTMNFNGQKIVVAVPLYGGKISVLDGILAAGDFELSLSDLHLSNQKDTKTPEIEGYLRDTLVFHTDEFPISRGILTKIERVENNPTFNYRLNIDLKIANLIRPIQCAANIQFAGSSITMVCEPITFDLIEWGIKNQRNTRLQISMTFRKEVNLTN